MQNCKYIKKSLELPFKAQTVDNVRGMRRGFFCINRQLKS